MCQADTYKNNKMSLEFPLLWPVGSRAPTGNETNLSAPMPARRQKQMD